MNEFVFSNVVGFCNALMGNEYDEIRKVAQAVRKTFEDHERRVVVDSCVWVIQFKSGKVEVYEIDDRCVRHIIREVA